MELLYFIASYNINTSQIDFNSIFLIPYSIKQEGEMRDELIILEKEGGVALVTINRPKKRNALSTALRKVLINSMERLNNDDDIEVVILTGASPGFCAGFDLGELMAATDEERDQMFKDSEYYHNFIYTFPKPLICAVNGPAIAGGFDLALLCDIRWASDAAYFQHKEVTFGVTALYSILKEVAGAGIARDLCLTGRGINAQEAFEMGIVSRVLSSEDLLAETKKMALDMAKYPNKILKQEKEHILRFTDLDIMKGA